MAGSLFPILEKGTYVVWLLVQPRNNEWPPAVLVCGWVPGFRLLLKCHSGDAVSIWGAQETYLIPDLLSRFPRLSSHHWSMAVWDCLRRRLWLSMARSMWR